MHIPFISSFFGPVQNTRFAPKAPLGHLLSLDAIYRQRRDLESLDARMLSDIGVTQAEAKAEASRKLWDVPSYWR